MAFGGFNTQRVNKSFLEFQVTSQVAPLVGGGWVVTWTHDFSSGGIFQKRYNKLGHAVGG